MRFLTILNHTPTAVINGWMVILVCWHWCYIWILQSQEGTPTFYLMVIKKELVSHDCSLLSKTRLKWFNSRLSTLGWLVNPTTGQGVLFDHTLRHESTELEAGVKYAIRTDVMYRRVNNLSTEVFSKKRKQTGNYSDYETDEGYWSGQGLTEQSVAQAATDGRMMPVTPQSIVLTLYTRGSSLKCVDTT